MIGAHPNSFRGRPVFGQQQILQVVDDRDRPPRAYDRRRERIGKKNSIQACAIDKTDPGFRRETPPRIGYAAISQLFVGPAKAFRTMEYNYFNWGTFTCRTTHG